MENAYELLYMSRAGDEYALQALFRTYAPIQRAAVNTMIARYRPMEIYREDMIQEAMILLHKAFETYREDQFCSFRSFLGLITERRIFSLLRHYSAGSTVQMHDMLWLEDFAEADSSIYEALPGKDAMTDPVYRCAYEEARQKVQCAWEQLKVEERSALEAYLSGASYQQSCQRLQVTYKTYDGRLQRARKKIHAALRS